MGATDGDLGNHRGPLHVEALEQLVGHDHEISAFGVIIFHGCPLIKTRRKNKPVVRRVAMLPLQNFWKATVRQLYFSCISGLGAAEFVV